MEVLRDFLKSPSVVCGHLLEQFIQHGLDVETLVTEIVLKEEFNALVVQPLHLSTSESSRIWHKLEHLRTTQTSPVGHVLHSEISCSPKNNSKCGMHQRAHN